MRRPTPDILDDLMGGAIKQENNTAVEQEKNKTIKQEIVKAVKKASNKDGEQDSNKEIKQENHKSVTNDKLKQMVIEGCLPEIELEEPIQKEKATFNLSKKTLAGLEDVWIEMRKLRGDKRVSKTDIVEQAIDDVVKDFQMKKELSKIHKKFEEGKKKS